MSSKHSNYPTPKTTAYSFQLPALDIPHASLTAGTSIPPPPPSPPPQSTPPRTPLESPNPLRSHPTSSHSLSRQFSTALNNGTPMSSSTGVKPSIPSTTATAASPYHSFPYPSQKRMAPTPSTPPASKRPHFRNLLSLRSFSLGSTGQTRQSEDSPTSPHASSIKRPESSLSTMSKPSLRKRKSSMFFGRKSSTFVNLVEEDETGRQAADRGSTEDEMLQTGSKSHKPRNFTPPPTLPELDNLGPGLKEVGRGGGWLGGEDMFSHIK